MSHNKLEIKMLDVVDAVRIHVPKLEQNAWNQMPKDNTWKCLKLYQYEGTNLFQWFGIKRGSFFEDPSNYPFMMVDRHG